MDSIVIKAFFSIEEKPIYRDFKTNSSVSNWFVAVNERVSSKQEAFM